MALFQSACRKEYLFQINRASGWLRSFGIGAIERSSTRKLFWVQPDRDGDQDKEWICGCLLSVSTLWIPKQCKFWLNKIILLVWLQKDLSQEREQNYFEKSISHNWRVLIANLINYLVMIVGYMMQIMSRSDVVVTWSEENQNFKFTTKSNQPNPSMHPNLPPNQTWSQHEKSPGCWSLARELIDSWKQTPPDQWSWEKSLRRRFCILLILPWTLSIFTWDLFLFVPELGDADSTWQVWGAEGELKLNLVSVILQRAARLELARQHLSKQIVVKQPNGQRVSNMHINIFLKSKAALSLWKTNVEKTTSQPSALAWPMLHPWTPSSGFFWLACNASVFLRNLPNF